MATQLSNGPWPCPESDPLLNGLQAAGTVDLLPDKRTEGQVEERRGTPAAQERCLAGGQDQEATHSLSRNGPRLARATLPVRDRLACGCPPLAGGSLTLVST